METEHFQAPFRVITSGSIQTENNQIEPSTTELTAWLLSKLYVVRQLKYKMKMIIQTDRFRESSCKHCKTAVLVEKSLSAFLACHQRTQTRRLRSVKSEAQATWKSEGKYYRLVC